MTEKDFETAAPMLMTTIIDRGEGDNISEVFAANGVHFNMLTLGSGTASKKILSYFGFGETEKDVIFSFVPYSASKTILEKLTGIFNTKKSGYGVAFCVPINELVDAANHVSFSADMEGRGGGYSMENCQHDLIIAITAPGYVDEIMDVAKVHGATGGTVLRARGVGAKEAEKFFGITVQAEKDMVFIVVKKELRSEMMTAIIKEKGPHSNAKAVLFSIPVDSVAGMNFETWSEKTR